MPMPWPLLALFCQDPSYDSRFLSVGSTVDQIVVRDIDGDTFEDLLVQSGKDLRLFLNHREKGILEQASQVLRFDANVYLWTLARIQEKTTWSIVTASVRGIHTVAFSGGTFVTPPRDLVIHPNLFDGNAGDSRPPAFVEFAPDLNRDGWSDLLLFCEEEIYILAQSENGTFRLIQKLPLPEDAQMTIAWNPVMRHKEERIVPMLTFEDATGDGRPDVSFYREESITIFEQKDSGTFSARSGLDLAAEKQKKRDRFFRFELPPLAIDLNSDGVQDLVLPYPSKGRVHVYYLGGNRTNLTTPDDVIQVGDSWTAGVFVNDLDHDRKPDLVVGIIRKFGIFGGLQAFVSGKIKMELHIHRMKSRFAQDPDQVLTFEVPFSFSVSRTDATVDFAFRPTFDADVNGDGPRDLLLSSNAETVQIYYGSRDRGLQQEPGGKLKLDAPAGTSYTSVTATDFNKDGRSDLLLKHIHIDQQRHFLQVKISKR